MSSQGNVCVMDLNNKKYKYIYTHYLGDELPVILKKALSPIKKHWSDMNYVIASICYDILKAAHFNFGSCDLSEFPFNSSQEIIFVDITNQVIIVGSTSLTFDDYIKQDHDFLKRLVELEKIN